MFIAKKVFAHPKWTGDILNGFNIGLIKLNKRAKFKRPTIDEKGISLSYETFLTAAGWGKTEKGKPSTVLRFADELIYVSRKRCQQFFRESPKGDEDVTIKDHMICAGLHGMDTCQGKVESMTHNCYNIRFLDLHPLEVFL